MNTLIWSEFFSTHNPLLLGECHFEQAARPFCGWKNLKTDKTDWRIGAGGTSTGGTGPSTDHTHGDKTGKDSFFMNLECVVHFNKTHLPD